MGIRNNLIAAFVICFVICVCVIAILPNPGAESYKLENLNGEIYAYYHAVESAVPEYNYQVITVCINGKVMNLAGEVKINHTRNRHKLVWENSDTPYRDRFELFVPEEAIIIQPTITLD